MTLIESAGVAWINGEAIEGSATFPVLNPVTGEAVVEAVDVDTNLINAAIDAGAAAFSVWSQTSAADRAALLRAWADLIEAHTTEIAEITTTEGGKLFREARGEVGAGTAAIRWSAQLAEEPGETDLGEPSPTRRHFMTKQPVGVVACITPWNFPIAAVLVKVGAAVAAGCTVVVKPSEETPLVASALAQLATDAGLPPGVVNVVATSTPSLFGDAIAARKEVRAVSFTGSTKVGKHLYEQCSGTVKRLSLELGGNAPFIVFADADIERAASDAVNARFYNTGQICVGANRFFVHDDIYDEFAEVFAAKVAALHVGDVMEEDADIGPLINRRAKDHFNSLLADATAKGASVATGGEHADAESLFVEPTVLTDATVDMDAYRKEIFGPMALLYRFSDNDEVVDQANDTDAGLAAYAYSEDHDFLAGVSARLEAGVVGLNTTQIFASELPFGGIKESGIGREWGSDCLDEFLEIKSVAFETGASS